MNQIIDKVTGEITIPAALLQDVLVIAHLDINAVPDDWESLTNLGMQIVEAHERNRWLLGDIAHTKIVPRYGEADLRRYANAINVRKSAIYQYRNTSALFELSIRPDFLKAHASLSWSHYFQTTRLADYDLAANFLDKAQDELWPVHLLKEQIDQYLNKPPSPKKLAVFEGSLETIIAQLTKALLDGDYQGGMMRAVLYGLASPEDQEGQQG